MSRIKAALSTYYPATTIIMCPVCEDGLYKVTRAISTAEILLCDNADIVSLNDKIPRREARQPFVCPECDTELLRDRTIYTLQYGWQEPV